MPYVRKSANQIIPEHQDVEHLNQAAPVQNTWYTIIDKANIRLLDVSTYVEVANETIQVKITIDGKVLTSNDITAIFGTPYFLTYMNLVAGTAALQPYFSTSQGSQYRSFCIEGRAIKIEIRKTTALGAGNLHGIVTYQLLS